MGIFIFIFVSRASIREGGRGGVNDEKGGGVKGVVVEKGAVGCWIVDRGMDGEIVGFVRRWVVGWEIERLEKREVWAEKVDVVGATMRRAAIEAAGLKPRVRVTRVDNMNKMKSDREKGERWLVSEKGRFMHRCFRLERLGGGGVDE